MTQTWAIFVDAYRRLHSKRLFWLTLALSAIVVACVGLIGIDAQGLSIGTLSLADSGLPMVEMVNGFCHTGVLSPADFYKGLFIEFGIGLWLGTGATLLGLISTADIFPDLVSRGAIDLALSKPIGRLRLFLTHYAAGLLFVTLQVGVFTAACFVLLGLRGGAWEVGLFIAVPIVVVFFSYLYGISVLFGVWTRSSITAILLTILCWGLIVVVNGYEEQLATNTGLVETDDFRQLAAQQGLTEEEQELLAEQLSGDAAGTSRGQPTPQPAGQTFSKFEMAASAIALVLPKTSATLQLLERWLVDLAHLNVERGGLFGRAVERYQKMNASLEKRSPLWIIGSSLVFELVVVSLAAWIFCRRDY